MILRQVAIGQLADRVEKAYRRRYPSWISIGVTPGVWESAAARLSEAGELEPSIPIDPELFVAVQHRGRLGRPDPWGELTQRDALETYLGAVRKIVEQLRAELRDEVRRARRQIRRGMTLDRLLAAGTARISPLALYILAHRAGRYDLSIRLRTDAEGQHRSCPLYRLASRSLLPDHAYPHDPSMITAHGDNEIFAFSVN